MAAQVCPKCWTYYGGDQKRCAECGGNLIGAELMGVYGGGRIDFAAETTPGIFTALEFLDIITFLRAALIASGALVLLLMHLAVSDHTLGLSFFGPLADVIQERADQMYYAYITWGVLVAWVVLMVRFKTARLMVTMAYGTAGCMATFFALTKGTQPLGFMAIFSLFVVTGLTFFSLSKSH